MNIKKFSETMGEIDSKYVENAINYQPKQKKQIWVIWGAIAACLAIMVYAGTRRFPQETHEDMAELPMLSITENTSEGMGFEGYWAYEVSELVNANPWSESLEISTLPVFHNPLTYDEYFIASGADFNKMQEFLLEIADRFGIDTNTLTITDDVPDEETKQMISRMGGGVIPDGYFDPTKLIIEADGLKIEVNQAMTATIFFEPAVSLADEYNFTDYAPYEDIVAVAEHLKTEYKNLIGIDNPQMNICGGDYNIYAQQSYSIKFFDASGNDTQKIINYNFNQVTFYCNSEGELCLARICQPDLSEIVGNYPIITPKQASELLLNGNFLTSVPYEMPGSEYVRKIELVYRTGELEEYYMPYYRFYVELLEDELENGLKTYGVYYVPAVDGRYISNMPTWDGSFN